MSKFPSSRLLLTETVVSMGSSTLFDACISVFTAKTRMLTDLDRDPDDINEDFNCHAYKSRPLQYFSICCGERVSGLRCDTDVLVGYVPVRPRI